MRVSFNSADRPRKNLLLNSTIYFRFTHSICTLLPPKRCYRTSPMRPARHISPPCSPLLRLSVFGWLLCVDLPIGGQFTPPCILFSLILGSSIQRPKRWDSFSPRAPPSTRHLSRNAFTNTADTRWLLCCPFKFRPFKAKATPIALLFDAVCVGIPNE